jgi:hypothetical protein
MMIFFTALPSAYTTTPFIVTQSSDPLPQLLTISNHFSFASAHTRLSSRTPSLRIQSSIAPPPPPFPLCRSPPLLSQKKQRQTPCLIIHHRHTRAVPIMPNRRRTKENTHRRPQSPHPVTSPGNTSQGPPRTQNTHPCLSNHLQACRPPLLPLICTHTYG